MIMNSLLRRIRGEEGAGDILFKDIDEQKGKGKRTYKEFNLENGC